MYTTKRVAQRAGKSDNTIRNWVAEYPDLFSPGAQGDSGQRLFTGEDAQTCEAIAALTATGLPIQEAVNRIRTQEAPPTIDVAARPLQQPSTALQPSAEASTIAQQAFSAMQSHIDTLARDLALVKQWQAERDKEAIYKAERRGATVALIFVGFLLLFAWLLVNGAS